MTPGAGRWRQAGLLCSAALTALVGCADGAGAPWGRLSLSARAAFAPPADRLNADGELLTTQNEAVLLSTMRVKVSRIVAVFGATGSGAAFDPANPPPGYSLCHNGHCHKDDGTLPTYDEIKLELAGAGSTATEVAWAVKPVWADALGGEALQVGPCLPGCDVGRGELLAWKVTAEAYELAGSARSTGKTGSLQQPRKFRWSATRTEMIGGATVLRFDREHAPLAEVALKVLWPAQLFDDVSLAQTALTSAAASGAPVDLSQDASVTAALVGAIAEHGSAKADVVRSEL